MTDSSDLNSPAAEPIAKPKVMPVISPQIGKRLASAVVVAGLATAAIAAIVIWTTGNEASWWAGYRAASIVTILAVLGSLVVIRQAVGRPVLMMPAVTMLLSAVRLGVSLAGLIVAVKTYKAPPEPTGVMICGYYAVVLGVESFVIHRALRPVAVEGNIKP